MINSQGNTKAKDQVDCSYSYFQWGLNCKIIQNFPKQDMVYRLILLMFFLIIINIQVTIKTKGKL